MHRPVKEQSEKSETAAERLEILDGIIQVYFRK